MEAREFVDELKRMMDSKGRTDRICDGVACSNCEFDKLNDCALGGWDDFESLYEVVNILEKWSKENPKKTNKDVLLEKFPNVMMDAKGTPKSCAFALGIIADCDSGISCSECWNEEYMEVNND